MYRCLSILVTAALFCLAGERSVYAQQKKPVASPDSAMDSLVSREAAQARVDQQSGPPVLEPADPSAALAQKDQELRAAKAEIQRLTLAMKTMQETTRRERQALFYNMGCVYKAARVYDKAEESFLKALELAPDDAAVHYNLGVLYDDDLKNSAKAKKHYARFLELATDEKDRAQVQEWLSSLK